MCVLCFRCCRTTSSPSSRASALSALRRLHTWAMSSAAPASPWTVQDRGHAGLANTIDYSRPSRLPEADRLLPKVHQGLRRGGAAPYAATQARSFLLVAGCGGSFSGTEDGSRLRSDAAIAGLRRTLHRQLRCVWEWLWGRFASRWGADRILQQAGGSLARQTGSVRARADRTCQGGAALASVLVEAAVRHAHGPLVPEVPPQPAPIHNSAAYVGKQAFWVCFQC